MSFSNDVRNELAREMSAKDCCNIAEISALCMFGGKMEPIGAGVFQLSLTLDNAATARKAFKLLKSVYGVQVKVKVANRSFFRKNRCYMVSAHIAGQHVGEFLKNGTINSKGEINTRINFGMLGKSCCKRSYLRGVFLSRGFISPPEGSYHMEIICHDGKMAEDISKLMRSFNLSARIAERKANLFIYLKDSDKIVDFLRLVGAHTSLLEFENVRILKSVRNNVNRQVNCETANLAKTIDASIRQVELIKNYVARYGWEYLPGNLRELAALRIEFPDYSLKELGLLLDPPLSKSGTAYRMRKLESLTEEAEES